MYEELVAGNECGTPQEIYMRAPLKEPQLEKRYFTDARASGFYAPGSYAPSAAVEDM